MTNRKLLNTLPTAPLGHNSQHEVLRNLIERVEKLTEEKSELQSDISDIMKEAKSKGFDPKLLREMLKLRKISPEALAEREALRDAYIQGLDLIS